MAEPFSGKRTLTKMPYADAASDEDGSPFARVFLPFLRLTIARKLFLGYLTLYVLLLAVAVFSLWSLERLNDINRSVIRTDISLIETSEKMIDVLLSQELYARRYSILKSPETMALFKEKSREFENLYNGIRGLPDLQEVPLDRLATLHAEYSDLFTESMLSLAPPSSPQGVRYDREIRNRQEELISLIKEISLKARSAQREKTLLTSQIGATAFRVTAILCVVSILAGIIASFLITKSIADPLSSLKNATKEISEGRFDSVPEIKNQDELGELFHAFRDMAKRLKQMEVKCLDASPLTRLPGNIAIENVLSERVEAGDPLAFCHLDIDDFKAFNDRYGYARGSEVLKTTARIVEKSVADCGTGDDFVGHIGGDDFVVITTPDRYRDICTAIIGLFDKTIPEFYDPEDRERGYINGKTRQGQEARFPFMTISIAVVTNRDFELTSHIQVGELAAELKEYAKDLPGSVYVVNKRRKEH